jgi:phosphoribosylformylglycinamidine synthase
VLKLGRVFTVTLQMFEARAVNVRVEKSNSVLLEGMEGSILPIAVAHGEGRGGRG